MDTCSASTTSTTQCIALYRQDIYRSIKSHSQKISPTFQLLVLTLGLRFVRTIITLWASITLPAQQN
ncbi:predicted protein [Sclerotinia sclerotiorum 1980 UF-70]|uniref:Uncharacterized protein n=1 Tax=Sclerotinia sclerotiorum (strain ATCC 18683 / 1980 / Ss-1) TaxID=665079 RepID=A7EY97_SCLS1|nr:predicted protein [Sclerotinia sclerotiorum 1980 UF-70]EDN94439.1 predicted protein [Sclerotinia sclerotiorum 1980 UF-70]